MLVTVLNLKPLPQGGLCPTEQQLLLLRMSLGLEQKPGEAFDQWRQCVNTVALDAGSFRLLPLFIRQLHSAGIDTSVFPYLERLSNSTWLDNWKNTKTVLAIEECFTAAEIPYFTKVFLTIPFGKTLINGIRTKFTNFPTKYRS